MRRILPWVALSALVVGGSSARGDEVGSAMADAAGRFLAALDEGQRGRAAFAFESPERVNWHWIPRERKGLPIKELKPAPRALAFGLLDTGLSTRGALKATTIMSLEEILRVDEGGKGPVRDPELYFVSVFGTPGDEGGWGWRIEGHHLALNYTLKGSKVVSATPFMFGSNPAEVRSGPRKGLRNLAEIELPARELFLSLDDSQRALAICNATAPDVNNGPNGAKLGKVEPEGISAEKLTQDQRATLKRLLAAYATNFPGPVAAELLDQIDRGESSCHFAWYGKPDPDGPYAFRVQSPTIFLDFNDTQNQSNHIHTFFRSVAGDFGL